MSQFSVALENTRNDLKGSDGRLLILTQTVLIFFLLTLALTGASIQDFLRSNLDALLGADMVVTSHDDLTVEQESHLSNMTSGFSKTQVMTITLANGEKWSRAQLKIIDDAYPLQGELKTANSRSGEHQARSHGPAVGEIWLGARASTQLGVTVGDQLTLGNTDLLVTAIIYHEPDRIMEGHTVAPRAMVHTNSFSQPIEGTGSRYRYLLTANDSERAEVEAWTSETLPAAQITKKEGGSHPLALFWQRTQNFLGLASVLLFFMAAVAIDMANRRHLARQQNRLALYLSFGTGMQAGLKIAAIQWGLGFAGSLLIGGIAAYGAEAALISFMADQFPGISWGLHVGAFGKTAVLAFALLLAFQVPMFFQLARTSLISLIRAITYPSALIMRMIWAFASLALLAAFYSDNGLLTAMVLTAMGAALLLMLALTWLVLNVGEFWARHRPGLLPFSFFMMKQRIFTKATQILGLGLCGLLLLFTLMLMHDIGASMERHTRTTNGNLIISQAQPKHIDAINGWAERTGSETRQLKAFTHAQLVAVNGTRLNDFLQKPSDSASTVQSPIRLSWSDRIPDNNRLIDGTWWEENTSDWHQISAEPEVMTDLGFEFGDTLSFQINGAVHDFKLVSSHAFKPGGGSVTFWFQAPPSLVEAINPPVRYMGSMELPETAWNELGSLWQQFPDLALVPIKEMTARFDETLAFVTKLTVGFAGMILVMAGIVIAASIKGFEADDRQKNGLLMSMGLGTKDCLKLNLYDWLVTALIASVGAVAGTWIAGLLIYESQFALTYAPDPLWLTGSILLTCLLVCSVGLAYCRHSLRASVKDLLAD